MAVLIGTHTRLVVQGLTGREGSFHARQAAEYGTTVVGGVTPGKGGTTHEGFPVFDTVESAVRETGANASVIFVPPAVAADAVMEAADAVEIRPRQDKDRSGEKIRGYWLKDLKETFERYPAYSELGQLGQPNNNGASRNTQSGTKQESCPSSGSPETRSSTGLSQLSQSEGGEEADYVFEGDL